MASFRLRPLAFTLLFNGGTKSVFSFLFLRHVQATLAFEHSIPNTAPKKIDGSPEAPQGQHLITRTVTVTAARKPLFLAHSKKQQERRGQRDIRKGLVHDIEILSKRAQSTGEIGKEHRVDTWSTFARRVICMDMLLYPVCATSCL